MHSIELLQIHELSSLLQSLRSFARLGQAEAFCGGSGLENKQTSNFTFTRLVAQFRMIAKVVHILVPTEVVASSNPSSWYCTSCLLYGPRTRKEDADEAPQKTRGSQWSRPKDGTNASELHEPGF
jgi:hypothetical protein